jgi:hypothetical protein
LFGGVDGRLHPGQLRLGGGQHDLFLGLELAVDGRLRHAELVGDHLQRRAPDAVPREQVERGGDHAGLRGARWPQRDPPGMRPRLLTKRELDSGGDNR